MDPIVTAPPVIRSAPSLPAPSVPALPAPAPDAQQPVLPQAQTAFDAGAAEQTRLETIQRLAQQIANVYVIGDQTFSLFKDVTGQYITRFTSLRDGKVTYIPEPTLFKLSGASGGESAALLKIQA